ncbi:type II toxin-antitoxin system RelE/ParE family toxin [Bacteroides sp. 51]|uniref:type II toxin-antitoxin system RelE/ParE family toxin n=1 Tax=Bacteroides sp. 51 TaxID=2302938 RepID=UPI0013D225E2|nr:type II toxin-antitoxin system RelE/ParE family toxin [Bacteroides sp. 51]
MFKLIVIDEAYQRIAETADYLFIHWNAIVQEKFISQIDRCLRIIINNPYSFCIDNSEPRLRKCVITPLNILYYTIAEKYIIIISLEDARRNPDNLRLI